MRIYLAVIGWAASCLFAGGAWAQPVSNKIGTLTVPCDPDVKQDEGKTCNVQSAFRGLHWGAAIVYSPSLGGVGTPKIVDGKVRFAQQNESAARAAFELHYFFPGKFDGLVKKGEWGWGPFVSLNTKPIGDTGQTKVFDSLGAGLMIGANSFTDTSSRHSINIGLGWLIDTQVKRLAPGVYEGMPTTLTDPKDLTTNTTKGTFMAILSYSITLN